MKRKKGNKAPPLTKDAILAALPRLNNKALSAIAAAAGALIGQGATPTKAPAQNDPQAWLYEALAAHLGLWGGYDTFLAKKPAPDWDAQSKALLSFMHRAFPNVMKGKKVQVMACMAYMLELISRRLDRRQVPVTLNTTVMCMGSIAEIFDFNFPGYCGNGLAEIAVRHKIGELDE